MLEKVLRSHSEAVTLEEMDHLSEISSEWLASDVQLRHGLNTDGLGQWRRYRTQMLPVMDTLEPWVLRYGYPPRD